MSAASRLLVVAALAAAGCSPKAEVKTGPAPPPPARTVDVSDTYHGVTVPDPYRWLEASADPEVQAWSATQTAYTRAWLDGAPAMPAVHKRVTELLTQGDAVRYGSLSVTGSQLFALKRDPALQQPQLVVMPVGGDPSAARVVYDPNAADPKGLTTIDWRYVSHDGKLVAISISAGGSEQGDVHVMDVASGKESEIIPNVQRGTAGGDLAWLPDDSGFYYTRYPRGTERSAEDASFYQQVWLHKLGQPADKDIYILGRDFPRVAEARLFEDAAAGRLLITVEDGDSARFSHFLRQKDGKIVQLSGFDDSLAQVVLGPNDTLYGLSWARDLKGEIVATSATRPDFAKAKTIVPASDGAISHSFYEPYSPTILAAGDRLYAVYQVGGPSELRVFDLAGKRLTGPVQQPVSDTFGLTDAGAHGVIFGDTSYVTTTQWHAFDPRSGATTKLAISAKETIDFSDTKVVREFATSKDGTKIPVNILMPKGAQADGKHAIVLSGYGGYAISTTPSEWRAGHILTENDVFYADANIRGGGEYGEQWHRDGMLLKKQNCYDDFIAVLELLIAKGYADPKRVGIIGGSNGGLMMGAILTQRPELLTVVVSEVGIYDMLRNELDTNGAFNIPEYGSVRDAQQFAALRAYSPYHNVKDNVAYPAILLTTGANDPRVNPMHSRKFAARLQAAQGGKQPILLRASADAGHGIGASMQQTIDLASDEFTFFFDRFGIAIK